MPTNPLAKLTFNDLDVDPERLREVATAFAEIRREIERLRELDLDETHPAVVFRPIARGEVK